MLVLAVLAAALPIPLQGKASAAEVPHAVGIAAGGSHSMVLKSDGTVWTWGATQYLELEEDATTDRSVPVQVTGLSGVTTISAGTEHSLALKNDGTLFAWGSNGNGQLGNGTTDSSNAPVQVKNSSDPSGYLTGVTAIAAGRSHSLAVSGGKVYAWGQGGGTTPAEVPDLTGVTAVAAGASSNLALTADGTVYEWKTGSTPAPVGDLTGVIAVAAGESHNMALKSDGTVWTWGANWYGQLGDGTMTERAGLVEVTGLSGVTAISAAFNSNMALKNDGTVWMWGANWDGQLGDGTTTDNGNPAQVPGLSGMIAVSARDSHSMALRDDGTVWLWGSNEENQIGEVTRQSAVPVQTTVTNAVYAAAGERYSLAVKDDGTVWAWGLNQKGKLGDGTTTDRPSPVQVQGLSGVVAVAAGENHSMAIRSDGTVWTWGWNAYGQLGDGTVDIAPDYKTTPVQAAGLTDIVAVSAGSSFSLALKSDGTVWAWGYNGGNQLGDGTTNPSSTPKKVSDLTGVVAISAGGTLGMAVKADGTVWAWGFGTIGDGTISSSTPKQVSVINDIAAVSTAIRTMVSDNNGAVWTWGNNSSGQLGNGTTESSDTPLQVPGLSGVIAVSAGTGHSMALKNDGTVWAWGANWRGQLGDGTTTNRLSPLQVPGLSGVAAISAGWSNHSVAVKNDGKVWAWGDNDYGQLGIGEMGRYLTSPKKLSAFLSNNADLSGLALSGVTLDPSFDADETSYTASVANSVTSITVTPTISDSHAVVTVNGIGVTSGTASGAVPLNVGANAITVLVTAHNGAEKSYTVTVTRAPSSHANLSGLALKDGSGHEIALSPAFAEDTNAYSAAVVNGVAAVTVTPTAAEPNATVKVNGKVVASGKASDPVNVPVGDSAITVEVTAQDRTTKETYSVKVTRAPKSQTSSGGGGAGGAAVSERTVAVTAAAGGTVTVDGAKIHFPAGAMDGDFRVTVERMDGTSGLEPKDGSRIVSRVFSLVKDKGGKFKKPVTVTLEYDPATVDESRYDFALYWYDEEAKQWVKLDNIRVDRKGTVSGDVQHFTKFAVLAVEKTAEEAQQPNPAKPVATLSDIQGHWAADAIKGLVELGSVKGYADGTFRPDKPITRAEFASIVVKAFGLKAGLTASFEDTKTHWARDAIAAAVAGGIVAGYDDKRFGPDDPITREQMAVMIVRASKLQAVAEPTAFTDGADISDWAQEAVSAVKAAGILQGYPDGTFRPQAQATRAMAAAMIFACLNMKAE
nr:S-layer homology domain-containing protein [Cohnella sp. CFH 77786]